MLSYVTDYICTQSIRDIGGDPLYTKGKIYKGCSYYEKRYESTVTVLHMIDELGDIRMVNAKKFMTLEQYRDNKIESIIQ